MKTTQKIFEKISNFQRNFIFKQYFCRTELGQTFQENFKFVIEEKKYWEIS